MTTVLLVEKLGNIKPLKIKEYIEEDFYKKCGYKSSTNFQKQHTWKTRVDGVTYFISLFAKTDVRGSLGENKYEFPPPVDSVLYFGTCLLSCYTKNMTPTNLTIELWNSVYNNLYGGFENLDSTAESDEREPDELDYIPEIKKTKEGYLKDGFVVETKLKKVTSNNTSSAKSKKSQQITSTSTKKIGGGGGGGGSSPSFEDEDSETEEDDSTVYTDIDDDDYDDELLDKSRGGKKKGSSGVSSKKKGSQKDESTVPIEITVNELLITDELTEEPYIE